MVFGRSVECFGVIIVRADFFKLLRLRSQLLCLGHSTYTSQVKKKVCGTCAHSDPSELKLCGVRLFKGSGVKSDDQRDATILFRHLPC